MTILHKDFVRFQFDVMKPLDELAAETPVGGCPPSSQKSGLRRQKCACTYAGDPLGTRGEAFSRRHKLGVLRCRRRIQTTGNEQSIDGRGRRQNSLRY